MNAPATIASIARILWAVTGLSVLTVGGVVYYRWDMKQRQIAELQALNAEFEKKLAERQQMIDRLSRSRRLAHLHVDSQTTGEGQEIQETTFTFIELDDDGRELARQRFTVPGNTIFIDAWMIKFDAQSVAMGELTRGKALVLFRRVYSDVLAPADGFEIDTPGGVPPGYSAEDTGRYEQRLWNAFWDLAQNPELASQMGVRVAQGEAVYKPVRAGQSFELSVDAIGGMNLRPLNSGVEGLTRAEP